MTDKARLAADSSSKDVELVRASSLPGAPIAPAPSRPAGLLEGLTASFAEALRPCAGQSDPAALLWTDADGQWAGLVPKLLAALPNFFVFGDCAPARRTGPAIWLRCIVDRSLAEGALPSGSVPILYLPGVGRQELRAAGECRSEVAPLVELQYRGRVWHQKNGRDWSIEAFLVSDDGLGLDVAQDQGTRDAMLRALPILAEAPLAGLRGRRLDAGDFDRLAVNDPVHDVLRWMGNPEGFRKGVDDARWQSFRNVCGSQFDFDPEDDGPSVSAHGLLTGASCWEAVWRRFRQAPRHYPGIPALLRAPTASQATLEFGDRNPSANEEAEKALGRALKAAAQLPHKEACERILALEAEHGARRDWVWAQLAESPLALALEPLARLAGTTRTMLGGGSVQLLAEAYAAGGWRADRAALDALAVGAGASSSAVVAAVVRALYEPWLDGSARHFQRLVGEQGGELGRSATGVSEEKETCLLFVDGLRFDVGALLQERLEIRGLPARLTHRVAPFPSVTATAKPLATPVHDALQGSGMPDDFAPQFKSGRSSGLAAGLRDEMARRGIAVFAADEPHPAPAGAVSGWTECGQLDNLGHGLGAGLASQLDSQVEQVAERVVALLDAGWQRVRVVTDHGWLLLPGGLPKMELPAHLVATKWARCAAVQGGATPDAPTYAWQWNVHGRVASPHGIACFRSGHEYSHGGLSAQECVVPELVVERAAPAVTVDIVDVRWQGLRCRVRVQASDPGLLVDLRLNWKQANTGLAANPKPIGTDGEVSLAIPDDHEGAAATVVVLDSSGAVLAHRSTTIGETS